MPLQRKFSCLNIKRNVARGRNSKSCHRICEKLSVRWERNEKSVTTDPPAPRQCFISSCSNWTCHSTRTELCFYCCIASIIIGWSTRYCCLIEPNRKFQFFELREFWCEKIWINHERISGELSIAHSWAMLVEFHERKTRNLQWIESKTFYTLYALARVRFDCVWPFFVLSRRICGFVFRSLAGFVNLSVANCWHFTTWGSFVLSKVLLMNEHRKPNFNLCTDDEAIESERKGCTN